MSEKKKESFFKRLFKKNKSKDENEVKEEEIVLDEVNAERMTDENIIE